MQTEVNDKQMRLNKSDIVIFEWTEAKKEKEKLTHLRLVHRGTSKLITGLTVIDSSNPEGLLQPCS